MTIRFALAVLLGIAFLEAHAGLLANPQSKNVQLTGQHAADFITLLAPANRNVKSFNMFLLCDSDQLLSEECIFIQSKLGEDINPAAVRGMMRRSDKNVKAMTDSLGIRVKNHLGLLGRQLGPHAIRELQVECRVSASEKSCTLTHIR